MNAPLSRRDFLRLGAGAAALACVTRGAAQAPDPLLRAVIPSSGQSLARIGIGTWQTFDVGGDATRRAQLTEVLRAFAAAGGDLIDTSPMYGSAETVLGDLAAATGLRDKFFFATKVWTTGAEAGERQMRSSFGKLRSDHVELMQVHNLVDWRTHLATLRGWQQADLVRHVGITHYEAGALGKLADIVRAEKIDFVQYALSLDEPEAAGDFLQLCADRGVAFIANRPFGGGNAFARTKGRALPAWAAEAGIGSWAQFLLKWVLGHAAVTCAIPGTSNPRHLADNLGAARGRLPDAKLRAQMAAFWRTL